MWTETSTYPAQIVDRTSNPYCSATMRILDFKAGGFSEDTSLLIEDGRIKWIGAEASHTLPRELNVVDMRRAVRYPGPV